MKAQSFSKRMIVLGPDVAPLSLVRNRHRHNFLVKSPLGDPGFQEAVDGLADHTATKSRPQIKIDVDPMSVM